MVNLEIERTVMEFDFSAEVESVDKVPEPFRPFYAQNAEGKFALSPDYTGAAQAIVGLNRSLKAARAEAKAKGGQIVDLSPLADFGQTPEEIKAAIQARLDEAQAEVAKGSQAKLNLDKIKQDLAEAHSRELGKYQTRSQALEQQLYGVLVENAAVSAISELKGMPELLMPFVKTQVKVKDENGSFTAYVVDAQGDQRYSGITGQPMTIKELVAEFKANEKFGRLFESEAPSGGGTQPGPRTTGIRIPPAQMSSTDKISAGLAGAKRR